MDTFDKWLTIDDHPSLCDTYGFFEPAAIPNRLTPDLVSILQSAGALLGGGVA